MFQMSSRDARATLWGAFFTPFGLFAQKYRAGSRTFA